MYSLYGFDVSFNLAEMCLEEINYRQLDTSLLNSRAISMRPMVFSKDNCYGLIMLNRFGALTH